ncbi:hypothetical protein G9A89_001158 [Geosiphon pyriformis]|nr:hypothetical protein G9A89_001158 [Geosiphon pyriformis]
MSNSSNYLYTQSRPCFQDKVKDLVTHLPYYAKEYIISLFPIINWIGRYNLTWLTADVIAGLTIGAVVIPQGMGYAKIAELPVEYGLYTSFVGVCIYPLFATSKDVMIGPTAIMSLLVGQSIIKIQKKFDIEGYGYSNPEIASAITFIAGVITFALGILHLGILVDFIPSPVIAGFSTGSAFTIAIGQIPKLLGIKDIDNKKAPYLVLSNTFGALKKTRIDAVMGLSSLLILYTIKYGCQISSRRYPRWNRAISFISIMRNIGVILLTTLISFSIIGNTSNLPISVLKTVPSGLDAIKVPTLNHQMISATGEYLPIIVLILIMEHVAIAKSFGRINNYKINPSQEMIAIGTTNFVSSFFGAYPATGSFSRSALASKSGIRTPLAGIFSGTLVILALYILTPAFYYIPDSSLAAVIIHAVLDLLSPPEYIKSLWKIQFWDFAVFFVGIVFTYFFSVEVGIYASTGLALLVLLVRIARPRFESLGLLLLEKSSPDQPPRYAYVALHHPSFPDAQNPPEGVLIFRFDESLTYPNSSYLEDQIVDYAKVKTRSYFKRAEKKGDRPWNDAGVKRNDDEAANATLPRLKAAVFDFSAVGIIDSTGVQSLIDIRNALNKYSGHLVEFHFANLLDQKIQDALIAGGFDSIDGNVNIGGHNDSQSTSTTSKEQMSKQLDVEMATNANIREKPEPNIHVQQSSKKFFHLTLGEALNDASKAALDVAS